MSEVEIDSPEWDVEHGAPQAYPYRDGVELAEQRRAEIAYWLIQAQVPLKPLGEFTNYVLTLAHLLEHGRLPDAPAPKLKAVT